MKYICRVPGCGEVLKVYASNGHGTFLTCSRNHKHRKAPFHGVYPTTRYHPVTDDPFEQAQELPDILPEQYERNTNSMMMNPTLAALVASDEVKLINVVFEKGRHRTPKYAYKCAIPDVAVNDKVIVEPSDEYPLGSVARVEEIDVDVNYHDSRNYKWVVQKVDESRHEKLLEQEQRVIDMVSKAEMRSKRDALRASLTALAGEDFSIPMLTSANAA